MIATRRIRRFTVALAFLPLPLLATGCTSSDEGQENRVNPCQLLPESNSYYDHSLPEILKTKQFRDVEVTDDAGVRRSCWYNHGQILVETFVAPKGSDEQYKELTKQLSTDYNKHAIQPHDNVGLKGLKGFWLTDYGKRKAVVFHASVDGDEKLGFEPVEVTIFVGFSGSDIPTPGNFAGLVADITPSQS